MKIVNNKIYKFKKILLKYISEDFKKRYILLKFVFKSKKSDLSIINDFLKSIKPLKISISSVGCINIIDEENFYKIPMTAGGKKRLCIEKANYQKDMIFPKNENVQYYYIDSVLIMRAELLKKFDNQKQEENEIKRMFENQFKKAKYKNINLKKHFKAFFEFIEKGFDRNNCDFWIRKIEKLENKPILIGEEHGDFHENNILRDAFGKIVLIDLDNYKKDGIPEYDILHYIINKKANENKTIWTIELKNILENYEKNKKDCCFLNQIKTDIKELCLLYFCNRINNEVRDNDNVPKKYVKNMIVFSEYIKEKI